MGSHTPGAWKVKVGHPLLVMGPNPAGKEFPDLPVASVPQAHVAGDANARLIAAAPEMKGIIEALLGLVEECDRCEGTGHEPRFKRGTEACHHCGGVGELLRPGACGEIGAMRAALAKVEGDSRG